MRALAAVHHVSPMMRGAKLLRAASPRSFASASGSASKNVADVIIVGGGHAGCEAAAAAARTGASTILITQRADTIGEMSCNPSIGGVGKGHLVREIDALDGIMAKCADEAGIHFRLLNRSKGPAVRGPRAQADRELYKAAVQRTIASTERLRVVEAAVDDLLLADGRVCGVRTEAGEALHANAVVLTAGTFLRGLVHIGRVSRPAGRFVRDTETGEVEPPTVGLAATLDRLGVPLSRLKTGTPPRLDGRTIDWSHPDLVPQPSEDPPTFFSYANALRSAPLASSLVQCARTFTNVRTHAVVNANRHALPLYEGEGIGPRYCPSINVKVDRFPQRDMHFVWLEPEGLSTHIVYPNGISGAFEESVQEQLVRTIGGLEAAVITQPGYDVEYDFIDPRALHASLEVRACPGLFLAGQIVGTTGYEEAAALGLHAGINAARCARGEPAPFVLGRHEAYIGVLVDDLTRKGTMEPYRMFTSRAEYRLLLRADNADARLTERGAEAGVVSDERLTAWELKRDAVARGQHALQSLTLPAAAWREAGAPMPLHNAPPRTAAFTLAMPGVGLGQVEAWAAHAKACSEGGASASDDSALVEPCARETVEVSIKYAEALTRQQKAIERVQRSAGRILPDDFDYARIATLSNEEVQKLTEARPRTLQEASEISGVTPHGIGRLLFALREYDNERAAARNESARSAAAAGGEARADDASSSRSN
jgi:tRNA uridine 5-carboxymethylaminomethyl modification enzyme